MGFLDSLENRACFGCLSITGLLLLVVLLPLSFSYLEYYEYGLEMRKSTGRVYTDQVYNRGRYAIGPDKKFLKYQADAHHERLDGLQVFSAGGGNESVGLTFKLDADYTFMLTEGKIGELHRELATSYESIIISRAEEAVKNEAAKITFTQYFQDRWTVESIFREAIQARWNANPPTHCTLDQFHLGRIEIPDRVALKQLQSRIQNERNEMEASLQQAQVEREYTKVQVNAVTLETENLLQTARAEAALVVAIATAEAARTVQEAQVNGTTRLFEATGIATQEHRTAFTYIRTLLHRNTLDLDVSYLSADNVVRTLPVV